MATPGHSACACLHSANPPSRQAPTSPCSEYRAGLVFNSLPYATALATAHILCPSRAAIALAHVGVAPISLTPSSASPCSELPALTAI